MCLWRKDICHIMKQAEMMDEKTLYSPWCIVTATCRHITAWDIPFEEEEEEEEEDILRKNPCAVDVVLKVASL